MTFTEKARQKRREIQALQGDLQRGLDVEYYVQTGHKQYILKNSRGK